ncbi:MAG: hypothetical protein H7144_12565 [Burkholderiales bacterium]|nr:hypothetical protein [Phycisphaerae bacterium]
MLNDIRPPPHEPHEPRAGDLHGRAHEERGALGTHHTRYIGEPTQTDPLYAMPFEERGSGFNIVMSIVALGLFAVLVALAWWTLG